MSFESCVSKPAGIRYSVLREDFLEYCENSTCPALLISYFEYWHNIKLADIHKQVSSANEGYRNFSVQPEHYHQHHSLQEIEKGIFGQYKRESISAGIDYLVDKGVLEIVVTSDYRRNQARVYRFLPDVLNDYIREKYTPSYVNKPVVSVVEKSTLQTYKEDSLGKDSKESSAAASSAGTKFVRRDRKQSLFPSQSVEDCFNHWNNLGYPLTKHKIEPSSKTFQACLQNIHKALKLHTSEVIKQAMTKYHTLLNLPNTTIVLAAPGHKVSLFEFFKFSKHTEERMIKQTNMLAIDSWFETCLKSMHDIEAEFGKYSADEHPKVTEELQKQYRTKIMDRKFSVSDINCFIKAAKFVVEYQRKNIKEINWNSCASEKISTMLFSRRLIDAVVDDAMDINMIEPTWLCSERTMNSRLPKYLKKCGLLDFVKAPTKILQKGVKEKYKYDPGYTEGEIE